MDKNLPKVKEMIKDHLKRRLIFCRHPSRIDFIVFNFFKEEDWCIEKAAHFNKS